MFLADKWRLLVKEDIPYISRISTDTVKQFFFAEKKNIFPPSLEGSKGKTSDR